MATLVKIQRETGRSPSLETFGRDQPLPWARQQLPWALKSDGGFEERRRRPPGAEGRTRLGGPNPTEVGVPHGPAPCSFPRGRFGTHLQHPRRPRGCCPALLLLLGRIPGRGPPVSHTRLSQGRSQPCPAPRGTSWGPQRGSAPGPAPLPRRGRLASALWSGCGRSQKNVSYYCLFLPGFSPPLPANKAFPIAEHTSPSSLPSSRTPGPSSILVALPRPAPPAPVPPQLLPQIFLNFEPGRGPGAAPCRVQSTQSLLHPAESQPLRLWGLFGGTWGREDAVGWR